MRKRIVGLAVLAAVLATALFGIPLAVAVGHYFITDEQHELERTADLTALAVSGDLTRARQPAVLPTREAGVQVSVYSAAGALVTGPRHAGSLALVRRAAQGAAASGAPGDRLAVAVPISDGDIVIGAVIASAARRGVYVRIAEAWLAMAGLAAAAIAVTWLIARRQARRLSVPLEELAGAAKHLGDGDFSVRTNPAGIAEIDTVNNSLDDTAGRLADLVERERAFSADASHQLRTPLTGLQLGIESALADPGSDARGALVAALETSRRLERTIDDLLALARGHPPATPRLLLDDVLDDVRARWTGPLAAADRPLWIERDSLLPSSADASPVLAQILDVLADNALRHGRGAVTVTARDAQGALAIDVSDEGPPITADPRELFKRGSTAGDTDGNRIGLALARRLAEAEGGRLVLGTRHPPTFTLIAGMTSG